MLSCIIVAGAVFLATLFLARVLSRCRRNRRHTRCANEMNVAFFHPYCNAGGGGERVLWCAIRAMQTRYPNVHCTVYTGDRATPQEILIRAEERFNIRLEKPIKFIFLKHRRIVEADLYPVLTLLGQSIGGLLLGVEALIRFVPDVFVDSMGYAFTLPLFRYVAGCSVGCYVHYPTISTDMLRMVQSGQTSYNNRGVVSRSPMLTKAKLIYYRVFAAMYGRVGRASQRVMVNSTWTFNHVAELWKCNAIIRIVYPPCDVRAFVQVENKSEQLLKEKSVRMFSIAQFRPEKNHRLQIESFALFLKETGLKATLVLAGGCRHEEDKNRVEMLKKETQRFGVSEHVEWKLNIPFGELLEEMSKAMIGLHTMWNEHFGIGVVELMAAGNITIAHNSGGPKLDIVKEGETGFLASTPEEYAKAMKEIVRMNEEQRDRLRNAARKASERFSDAKFEQGFNDAIGSLL